MGVGEGGGVESLDIREGHLGASASSRWQSVMPGSKREGSLSTD